MYLVCISDGSYYVLAFIRFHTDNLSLEPKKTFVLLFCEELELTQKLVHVGFLVKSTIVSFGALRVAGKEHFNVSIPILITSGPILTKISYLFLAQFLVK